MLNVNLFFIHMETSMLPEEENSNPTVLSVGWITKEGMKGSNSWLLLPPENTEWSAGASTATGITPEYCNAFGVSYKEAMGILQTGMAGFMSNAIPVVWDRSHFAYSEYRLLGRKEHQTTLGVKCLELPIDLREYSRVSLIKHGADTTKFNSHINSLLKPTEKWNENEKGVASTRDGRAFPIRPMITRMMDLWGIING